ncbi:MAG: hypothetical protein AAF589_04515 [Planctomycetota bacterium]
MRALQNIAVTLLPVLILVSLAGCSNTQDSNGDSSRVEQDAAQEMPREEQEPGWPKDPQELVDHLNDWHADELLAYNEPERFSNRVMSGETNGWISAHEDELKKLGVMIAWDKTDQAYKIVDPKD